MELADVPDWVYSAAAFGVVMVGFWLAVSFSAMAGYRYREKHWEWNEAEVTGVRLYDDSAGELSRTVGFAVTVRLPGGSSHEMRSTHDQLVGYVPGLPTEPRKGLFSSSPDPSDQEAFELALVGRRLPVLVAPDGRRVCLRSPHARSAYHL